RADRLVEAVVPVDQVAAQRDDVDRLLERERDDPVPAPGARMRTAVQVRRQTRRASAEMQVSRAEKLHGRWCSEREGRDDGARPAHGSQGNTPRRQAVGAPAGPPIPAGPWTPAGPSAPTGPGAPAGPPAPAALAADALTRTRRSLIPPRRPRPAPPSAPSPPRPAP